MPGALRAVKKGTTMTDQKLPTIRISSPAQLVAGIPALLGFRPTESPVAVLLEGRMLRCTMRIDLTEGVVAEAERIADISRRAGATAVLLVIYSTRGSELWAGEVDQAIELLTSDGLTVSDALLVDDGRFWSFLCQDATCCPPEGRPVPAGVTELEVHRVAQGSLAVCESRECSRQVYRARDDLAPSHEHYDRQEAALERPLAERYPQALSDALELMEAHEAGHPVDRDCDDTRARLALLLHDSTVRDYLIASLTRDHDLRSATGAMTWLALTAARANQDLAALFVGNEQPADAQRSAVRLRPRPCPQDDQPLSRACCAVGRPSHAVRIAASRAGSSRLIQVG